MDRLIQELHVMQRVLSGPLPGGHALAVTAEDVGSFVRSLRRKIGFLQMHMAFLSGIEWERADSLGRRTSGSADRNKMSVRLSDESSLVIEHPDALKDHVYMALDGITASVVNLTDTFARLMNVAYSLGINPRQSGLGAVRDKCSPTSTLGVVLWNAHYTDWLQKLRDIRGRCQHADIAAVLIEATGSYSEHKQPHIDSAYDWQSPPMARLVVQYASDAMQKSEECLLAAIGGVLSTPHCPVR